MELILLIGCVLFSRGSMQPGIFPTKANLVEINDQEENHFLWQRVKATKKDHWVGASDLQITEMYRWLNSGKVVGGSSYHWGPGEPTRSEHCMDILWWAPTSNYWNDAPCTYHQYFICETPAK